MGRGKDSMENQETRMMQTDQRYRPVVIVISDGIRRLDFDSSWLIVFLHFLGNSIVMVLFTCIDSDCFEIMAIAVSC